jgi:hypothetical protein
MRLMRRPRLSITVRAMALQCCSGVLPRPFEGLSPVTPLHQLRLACCRMPHGLRAPRSTCGSTRRSALKRSSHRLRALESRQRRDMAHRQSSAA